MLGMLIMSVYLQLGTSMYNIIYYIINVFGNGRQITTY